MVKFEQKSIKKSRMITAVKLLILVALTQLGYECAGARERGDDIILTKGKLIMRGGKGKGNLILDTGSKSNEHHGMPLMPMMHHGHHFNPFLFYPMHDSQHHHQPPPMMMHPIYIEDHSAMHHQHQHQHQPEHHHQEYHHESHPHQEHHEVHQFHHQEPMQHHHMGEDHPEMHHEQHYEIQPMSHHHYDHEGHHEEEGHHSGYESNPMVAMMMYGSAAQPTFQQLTSNQALDPQVQAQYQQQFQRQMQAYQDAQNKENQLSQLLQQPQPQNNQSQQSQQQQALPSEQQKKVVPASSNPLAAIIKPLLNLNPLKQKKPQS